MTAREVLPRTESFFLEVVPRGGVETTRVASSSATVATASFAASETGGDLRRSGSLPGTAASLGLQCAGKPSKPTLSMPTTGKARRPKRMVFGKEPRGHLRPGLNLNQMLVPAASCPEPNQMVMSPRLAAREGRRVSVDFVAVAGARATADRAPMACCRSKLTEAAEHQAE